MIVGKATFPNPNHLKVVEEHNLAPIRYVDDAHQQTEIYPFNPNGSPNGIAALTSFDGRHLAMMPHPERCYQYWQWPYHPSEYDPSKQMNQFIPVGHDEEGREVQGRIFPSPWLKIFQNAVDFCNA